MTAARDLRLRVVVSGDDQGVAAAIGAALGMPLSSILCGALHRGLLIYARLAVEIQPACDWPDRPALVPVTADDLAERSNAHYDYWLQRVRRATRAASATPDVEGCTGRTSE